MSREAETMNREKSETPNPPADHPQKARIVYVVYVIAALDITWMFLQFSVTPVSRSAAVTQGKLVLPWWS